MAISHSLPWHWRKRTTLTIRWGFYISVLNYHYLSMLLPLSLDRLYYVSTGVHLSWFHYVEIFHVQSYISPTHKGFWNIFRNPQVFFPVPNLVPDIIWSGSVPVPVLILVPVLDLVPDVIWSWSQSWSRSQTKSDQKIQPQKSYETLFYKFQTKIEQFDTLKDIFVLKCLFNWYG